jgi:hypothetical protein
MAGTVASAFINYRKLQSDREQREGEAAADFLALADQMEIAGDRLLHVITLVGENGHTAFDMTNRLLDQSMAETTSPVKVRQLTLRAGATSIDLRANERQRWGTLVGETARGVEMMNEAVGRYEEAFSAILQAGRRLEQVLGASLEEVIGDAVKKSIRFRKAIDSYQNLQARSSLGNAQLRFERIRESALEMVRSANGFAILTRIIIQARRG